MTKLKVGIASLAQYKSRTMAIARREYVPAPDEPKVWFESLETMSQVISDTLLCRRDLKCGDSSLRSE